MLEEWSVANWNIERSWQGWEGLNWKQRKGGLGVQKMRCLGVDELRCAEQ
jgi:hypothetical protein